MQQIELITSADKELHSVEAEGLERRIMDLALQVTGAKNGAIFLWDDHEDGLAVHFHYVDGVVIKLPGVVLRRRSSERRNGIALWVMAHNRSYLCNETADDPHYAAYFRQARSVVAVPIPYQQRPIGVVSVSSPKPGAFREEHCRELEKLAASAAKHLRRAQLYWSKPAQNKHPFLIKGLCPEWMEVERQIELVAPTDVPVLIQGESGTGKELVANAIHFNSARSRATMVTVNCATIPETLLESTLFGHVKGAFTGATTRKIGEFRKAHGSTLFLDEIGDLPLSLQAKVLRALEYGEVQPLGSNAPPEQVDVRVVCATHRNLAEMVRRGQFRDDLYYRLSVMVLQLPPLRNYKDNLPVMAEVFVMQAARRLGRPARRLAPQTLEVLDHYDYPGNVRELRNAMEHAVIMCTGEEILPEHLPRTFQQTSPISTRQAGPSNSERRPTLREMRERWLAPLEKRYLLELLQECSGSVARAARLAGINQATMYRLLKKRGVSLRRFSGTDSPEPPR